MIGIVTDSASDISFSFANEHGIKVVPLSVTFHAKTYLENEDFDVDAYYSQYSKESNFMAKTSQPSPKLFLTAYEELIAEGVQDIIVICISSALSGTLNSARIAANVLANSHPDVSVHLIDSLNASYPEVFLVEEALDLIEKKVAIDEIVAHLRSLVPEINTFILIPDLKYLHMGGRISIAKYLLAKLLRKKVITRVNEEGKNEQAAVVNSTEEGLKKLIELTKEERDYPPRKLAIVHGNNYEAAEEFQKIVETEFPKADIRVERTGVTISAHTGPNAVALISDFGVKK